MSFAELFWKKILRIRRPFGLFGGPASFIFHFIAKKITTSTLLYVVAHNSINHFPVTLKLWKYSTGMDFERSPPSPAQTRQISKKHFWNVYRCNVPIIKMSISFLYVLSLLNNAWQKSAEKCWRNNVATGAPWLEGPFLSHPSTNAQFFRTNITSSFSWKPKS